MEDMSWLEKKRRDCRNNAEIIGIFLFTVLITTLILWKVENTVGIFLTNGLNKVLFGFLGSLFGLLLTTYAMFFGIVPHLNKELKESDNLKKVNTKFFVALMIVISMIALSLILFFKKSFLILALLIFLFIFDVLLLSLIVIYLFLFFRLIHH